MKVGVRKLRGKVTTKKAATKKKAVKKVTKSKSAKSAKMAKVMELREGFKKGNKYNPLPHFRYLNTTVSDIANEKFPQMVQITTGPTKFKELFGKRYVNETFAKLAIDTMHGDSIVDRGRAAVKAELQGIGIFAVDENTPVGGGDVPLN